MSCDTNYVAGVRGLFVFWKGSEKLVYLITSDWDCFVQRVPKVYIALFDFSII